MVQVGNVTVESKRPVWLAQADVTERLFLKSACRHISERGMLSQVAAVRGGGENSNLPQISANVGERLVHNWKFSFFFFFQLSCHDL